MINTRTCNFHPAGARLLTLLFAAALLASCGEGGKSSAKSQVAARVNDREITVSQLNQTLQEINPEAVTPAVTRRALDALVDEELLVQAAIKNKLDRDPATVAAIEHSRRQILAQAYAERMLFPSQPVSQAASEKYYQDNPALFEHRRLYRLTVYSLKQSDMNSLLEHDLNATHAAEQVREVLDRHEIKYQTQYLNSAAEELPLDHLAQFAKAEVGDLIMAKQADGSELLIAVAGLEDRPLPFERAKGIIEQYLVKARNRQAVQDHLKAQKAAAHISYLGDFARPGATP